MSDTIFKPAMPPCDMPNEKSCGIIIFRKGRGKGARKYLLLHYEEGHWGFPKGHVEKNESEHETAIREALEETGLSDLDFVTGFREHIEYFYKREGQTMHKEVFFFLARTSQPEKDVKLSSEHVGFKWLSYEKALDTLTYDNAKELLKKAEKFLENSLTDYV